MLLHGGFTDDRRASSEAFAAILLNDDVDVPATSIEALLNHHAARDGVVIGDCRRLCHMSFLCGALSTRGGLLPRPMARPHWAASAGSRLLLLLRMLRRGGRRGGGVLCLPSFFLAAISAALACACCSFSMRWPADAVEHGGVGLGGGKECGYGLASLRIILPLVFGVVTAAATGQPVHRGAPFVWSSGPVRLRQPSGRPGLETVNFAPPSPCNHLALLEVG
jgi:hypothetical protein